MPKNSERFAMATCLIFATLPISAQVEQWSYLQNASVRLGVRMDYGAGVAYFAKTATGRNLLNHADHGRLLQQSFYGTSDGSTWNGQPWRWNPVQGGCWTGKVSGVVQEFRNDGTTLYARTQPVNWGGCDVIDAVMEEWIELVGNVAVIRFKFTNNLRDNTNSTDQEMPAVYVDYALSHLVYYDGGAPWSNGGLTRKIPGWPNARGLLTENWAAFVDDQDWGLGVFTPGTRDMTYFRYVGDGSIGPDGAACSYFAPTRKLTIIRGFSVEYTVYVSIGTVPELRREFRYIHETGKPQDPGTTQLVASAVRTSPPRVRGKDYSLLGRRRSALRDVRAR